MQIAVESRLKLEALTLVGKHHSRCIRHIFSGGLGYKTKGVAQPNLFSQINLTMIHKKISLDSS